MDLLVQLRPSTPILRPVKGDAVDAVFLQLARQDPQALMVNRDMMAPQAIPEKMDHLELLHPHNANNILDVKNALKHKLARQANQDPRDHEEIQEHPVKQPTVELEDRLDHPAPQESPETKDTMDKLESQANQELFAPFQASRDPQAQLDLLENEDPLDRPEETASQDYQAARARKETMDRVELQANQAAPVKLDHREIKDMVALATTAHLQGLLQATKRQIRVEFIPSSQLCHLFLLFWLEAAFVRTEQRVPFPT